MLLIDSLWDGKECAMRMLFRTFSGYEDPSVISASGYSFAYRGVGYGSLPCADKAGVQVIYSDKLRLNSRCYLGFDHYAEHNLEKEPDFEKLFIEAAKFASEYFEIGCVTLDFGKTRDSEILTENVYMNAYAGRPADESLFVLFNARPTAASYSGNIVAIGRDYYSLERDQNSIIVWNLDRYKDIALDGYTLWGIKHDTGRCTSNTDDVMVGLENGKIKYAIH